MPEGNGTSPPHGRPIASGAAQLPRERAECTHRHPDLGAVQNARTPASLRAEEAFHDWTAVPPSQRPLWKHRGQIADALGVVLKRHDISKNRFAMMLGVDKKQVRRMLACEQPIHIDVLFALPLEVALDFVEILTQARGAGAQRGIVLLGQSIGILRASASATNRAEIRRAAREAQRQLLELDEHIAEDR